MRNLKQSPKAELKRNVTSRILRGAYRKLKSALRSMRRKLIFVFPEVSQRRVRQFLRYREQLGKITRSCDLSLSIAIVVPCYKHGQYLRTMVTSIKSQTRPPDQVIFVDDHSPDATAQTLQNLIEDWQPTTSSQIKLLRNEGNLGQTASLNRGIGLADTDLILILNDDDYLLHDCVEVAVALFECYPEIALLGAHSLHFSGDDALWRLPKFVKEFVLLDELELDLRLPECVRTYHRYNDLNMTHSGSCFLKAAWRAVGGYFPDKRNRLVPQSDRDFQLRVNALFPVMLSNTVPFSCWRNDSSVDAGINS